LRGKGLTILRNSQRLLRVYVPHLGDFEGDTKPRVRCGGSEVEFVDIEIRGVVEFRRGIGSVGLGKLGNASAVLDVGLGPAPNLNRNINTTYLTHLFSQPNATRATNPQFPTARELKVKY
jgi:hypothetical protein